MVSVVEAVAGYLDHLTAEVGASDHTIAAYRRDLLRYAEYLAERGVTDVVAVTAELVAGFSTWLREESQGRPGLAASSAARAVVAVRSFHRFAVSDGITGVDPAARVAPPRQGSRLPKALSIEQLQALLEAPDRTTPKGLRDAALLELLYATGARVSEIVTLDVDDVTHQLDDPDRGLRLFGKGRKEREVPLGSYARQAIGDYLVRGRPVLIAAARHTGPALFLNTRGDRLSRQSAFAVIREQADRAGIGVDIGPHTLRHSFATHLLDGGADVRVVQELLGHASVTTTQIYTKVTAEHLREVFCEAHPRAR